MTQNEEFLNILRERPVNSLEPIRTRFVQMPRIIKDLQREGYIIDHVSAHHQSTTYKLLSEPPQPKKPEYKYIGNTAIQIGIE